MATHKLKCWSEPFNEVMNGQKKFEYRLNDRNYEMEDFTLLVYVAIGFTSLIMVVIALALISLGNLIENTPDGRERRGELVRDDSVKNSLLAPKNISRVFAISFIILFLVGCLIVILSNGSKVIMIIGGVTMFSAFLFSTTIVVFELMIYQTMQKNLKELKGSVVA
jgi:hypothetical protein